MNKQLQANRRIGEAGQVLPLIALGLAVVMGFAGMAVDVGYLQYRQQQQQSATDAAALGGAQRLASAGCPGQSVAKAAAQLDAADNGYTDGSGGVTVAVQNPPAQGSYSDNSCAVSVTITTQHVATFFTRLFGYSNGMAESTQSTAIVGANSNACIYLLLPSTPSDLSNAHLNAPGCRIIINDTANMSNASIDAAEISYAGAAPNTSGATFAEAAPAPALITADPCPEIAGCADLTNSPPAATGCSSGTFANTSINQGCYTNLNLSGTVTLNPGVYVINGSQFHVNNATVTGNGVTIYMTSGINDVNFSNANITLSPPTSGNTVGVLFYRPGSQSSAIDLSHCTCSLSGLLYFPTTQVNYSNAGGGYSVLVFGEANFSSSTTSDFATPALGQALVGEAVLAQ